MNDSEIDRVLRLFTAAWPAVNRPEDTIRLWRSRLSRYDFEQVMSAAYKVVDIEDRHPSWAHFRAAIEAEGRSTHFSTERPSPFDSTPLEGSPRCPLCGLVEFTIGCSEAIVREGHWFCDKCSTVFAGTEAEWAAMADQRHNFAQRARQAAEGSSGRQAERAVTRQNRRNRGSAA